MYLMDAAQMDWCKMKVVSPLVARDCQRLDSSFHSLEQTQTGEGQWLVMIMTLRMRIVDVQGLSASPTTDQPHEETLKSTTGVVVQVPFLVLVSVYQAFEGRSQA